MFAIAVELLAGRYTATQYNNRNEAEWPPHPARLYLAMVASWADSDDPDPRERTALRWLEDQGAPVIHCGEGNRRSIVTHFVPVNDPSALARGDSWARSTYASLRDGRQAVLDAEHSGDQKAIKRAQATLAKVEKKATGDTAKAGMPTGKETASIAASVMEVLPEFRGKQGRTYPTAIPDKPSIWFVWPDADPHPEVIGALDEMLGRVGRIGHSSTLVACRCESSAPGGPPTWVPGGEAAETRLRVPRTGMLDRLEIAYQTHLGEEPRTMPAAMTGYQRPGAVLPQIRRPLLGGDWYVLGFADGRFPAATRALAVTRAVRKALLAHGDQPVPEFLSGHQLSADGSGPTPPSTKPHIAVVPLLNAGSPYSDGTIFAVAVILPSEATSGDRTAVEHALWNWDDAGFELMLSAGADGRAARFRLDDLVVDRSTEEGQPAWLSSDLASRRKTTRRDYWCRPSKRWLTVTPIALDRFPGNLRSQRCETRERAEFEAKIAITDACVNAGLVEGPGDVNSITVRLDAPLVGLPASPGRQRSPGQRVFPGYQTGGTRIPRVCVHAEIEFAEPVQGPVLIGAGRFLGYGLCVPRFTGDRKGEAQR